MPVVAPSVAVIEADAASAAAAAAAATAAAAAAAAAEYKTSVSGPTTTATTATINTGTVPTANLITTTTNTNTNTNTTTTTTTTTTTSTTAIVVVADDFGMSKARNEGIARAICNGVVTATSIVANAPAADAALALAREKGFLGAVGLHLNLTEGRPVAEPTVVPSLLAPPPAPAESFTATTNGDTTTYGCGSTNVVMRGKGNLRAACNAAAAAAATAATTNAQGCPVVIGHHSVVDPAEAAIEARAQLDWYTARVGVPPPYVDGHQHCHVIPALVSTLAAEFQRAGVQRVRIPAEPGAAMALCPTCSRVTSEAEAARSVFAEAGLSATQGFVGLSLCGLAYGVDECMAAVCAQIARPGVSSIEIMTHPGLCSASDDAWDAFDAAPARERELKVLCDPQLRLQLEALPARLARHA